MRKEGTETKQFVSLERNIYMCFNLNSVSYKEFFFCIRAEILKPALLCERGNLVIQNIPRVVRAKQLISV
jgi:hypothetical protein